MVACPTLLATLVYPLPSSFLTHRCHSNRAVVANICCSSSPHLVAWPGAGLAHDGLDAWMVYLEALAGPPLWRSTCRSGEASQLLWKTAVAGHVGQLARKPPATIANVAKTTDFFTLCSWVSRHGWWMVAVTGDLSATEISLEPCPAHFGRRRGGFGWICFQYTWRTSTQHPRKRPPGNSAVPFPQLTV